MAQTDDGNVQPIRTIDDEAALAWLRLDREASRGRPARQFLRRGLTGPLAG